MWIVFWSVFSIFVVLGIDYVVKELIKIKLKSPPDIIVCGYKNENETEYTLRRILFFNPDSEIYVIKKNETDSPVLKKMSDDHPNIHIHNLADDST